MADNGASITTIRAPHCRTALSNAGYRLVGATARFGFLRQTTPARAKGKETFATRTHGCRALAILNRSPASLLQLLLPAEHPRLIAFHFGLRNHSFFLIQDGEAGMGQDVVGIDF
jgi:hypothetical protein